MDDDTRPDAGPFAFHRFVEAQDPVLDAVRRERSAGLEETHWMWDVFPQLAALGRSATARRFGLSGIAEAKAWLAHPVLGPRLREWVGLTLRHDGMDPHAIFGSPDDLKCRSCLTLFREAAQEEADRALFQRGLEVFYGGEGDGGALGVLK